VVVSYKHNHLPAGAGLIDLEQGHFEHLTYHDWITDTTIDNGVAWGYLEGGGYKTSKQLIHYLADGGSREARSRMAWADTAGGMVIASAGVTLPHGLGMQLGGHCPQVSHGQSLAVFYPEFTRYTWRSAPEKFAALGRLLDPALKAANDPEAAEGSCQALDRFLKKIGLWIDFKSLGVSKEEIRAIADCGQVLGDYKNNPKVASIPEMYASKLWQKASNPVWALTSLGMETVSSGSTRAILGKMFLCQMADLSFFEGLVITAQGVVWLPVPAVVPTAMMGRVFSVGPAV
jgi:hypothetical protein